MRKVLAPQQFHSLTIAWNLLYKFLSEPDLMHCKVTKQKTHQDVRIFAVSRQSIRNHRVHKIRNDEWLTQ
jgi:hypothetical protein